MADENESYNLESIARLAEQLGSLNSGVAPVGDELSGGIKTSLKEFDKACKNPFEPLFNDTNINKELGEGLNLIKGDAYCNFIPEEFGYYRVRFLILNNLKNGFEGIIQDVLKKCEAIFSAAAAAQAKHDALYMDWVYNREKYYPAGTPSQDIPHFGDPGASWEEDGVFWPSQETDDYTGDMEARRLDFFERNMAHYCETAGLNPSEYQPAGAVLSGISTVLNEATTKINSAKDYIKQWLDLGYNALIEVSFVYHIKAFDMSKIAPNDITLYEKLRIEREPVSEYTERVIDALDIIHDLKQSHLDATEAEMLALIKNTVLTRMDIAAESAKIYDAIDALFKPAEGGEGA